jgi:osmotically-inducible protein OsmY
MKQSKTILTIVLCATEAFICAQAPDATPKPDNTKLNQRDRNSSEATADQQKTNAADQDLTKKIRQSIMADKSLSSYAHNIKIISQHGAVTMKGPVKSDNEKKTLMEKAVAVAGSPDKVTDEISVQQ